MKENKNNKSNINIIVKKSINKNFNEKILK